MDAILLKTNAYCYDQAFVHQPGIQNQALLGALLNGACATVISSLNVQAENGTYTFFSQLMTFISIQILLLQVLYFQDAIPPQIFRWQENRAECSRYILAHNICMYICMICSYICISLHARCTNLKQKKRNNRARILTCNSTCESKSIKSCFMLIEA